MALSLDPGQRDSANELLLREEERNEDWCEGNERDPHLQMKHRCVPHARLEKPHAHAQRHSIWRVEVNEGLKEIVPVLDEREHSDRRECWFREREYDGEHNPKP